MNVRRTASIGSALVVAGIAALASYTHMRGLSLHYGQTEAIADLLPISVDGMMVVATIALGDGRRYRWSAWLAFALGVVASVVANVLAAQPSAIARCISAWPAVAFLLVVEVITRRGRAAVPAVEPVPEGTSVPDTEQDTEPVNPWDYAEPIAPAKAPDTPPAPKRTPARTPKASGVATKAAKILAKQPDIKQADLAAKLGVSERTLRRHLSATEPATPPVNGTPVPELVPTTN